jgi:hypothetical protein
MNQKRIVITNLWTEIKHGHARSELESVKNLCAELEISAEIYSIDFEYGQLHPSQTVIKNLNQNSRSRLCRLGAKLLMALNLRKILLISAHNYEYAFLTSARPNDLWLLLILPRKKPSIIRLIDGPSTGLHSTIFRLIHRMIAPNLKVYVETSAASELIYKNCGLTLDVLPSIQGLAHQTKPTRGVVAILWPVSYKESRARLRSIIKELSNFELIIRFPRGVDVGPAVPENARTIELGVSDSEFINLCSEADVAVLPHQDYGTRGSGLMATFAGMGKPIITDTNNRCVDDLVKHGAKVVDLKLDTIKRDVQLILAEKPITVLGYRNWTLTKWTEALGIHD